MVQSVQAKPENLKTGELPRGKFLNLSGSREEELRFHKQKATSLQEVGQESPLQAIQHL